MHLLSARNLDSLHLVCSICNYTAMEFDINTYLLQAQLQCLVECLEMMWNHQCSLVWSALEMREEYWVVSHLNQEHALMVIVLQ